MLSYVFNVCNVNNYYDCSRCRELLRRGFRRPSAALRLWSMWTSYLSPALGASQRVGVKPWGWVLDLRISKQELWLSGCLASLLLSLLSNKSAVYFRGWKEKLRNPGLQWIIRCSYPTPCSAVVFCETWLPTWHLLGIPQNSPESSEEKKTKTVGILSGLSTHRSCPRPAGVPQRARGKLPCHPSPGWH